MDIDPKQLEQWGPWMVNGWVALKQMGSMGRPTSRVLNPAGGFLVWKTGTVEELERREHPGDGGKETTDRPRPSPQQGGGSHPAEEC